MKLSARVGIVGVAIALAAGLTSAPVSAGAAHAPHPDRIRPSQLPVGAEPEAAWLTYAEPALHRRDRDPVPVEREGASPAGLFEVPGGWLVPYQVFAGPGRSTEFVLLDRAGGSRVVARSPRPVQLELVSPNGRTFVTSDKVRTRGARYSTVLRRVRISDGRVLATRRIAHERRNDSETVHVVQATARRVLLERVGPVGDDYDGPTRYTTMWWTPATGTVAVVSRQTQARRDRVVEPVAVSIRARAIVLRDRRSGQTVRDLGTRRSLWRLPAGEHAADFSTAGGVLLTITAPSGPNQVRSVRARTARTGALLATFRGTLSVPAQAWESPRTFVMVAADGVFNPDFDGEAWRNPATIRCSIATAACRRVPIEFGAPIAQPRGGY